MRRADEVRSRAPVAYENQAVIKTRFRSKVDGKLIAAGLAMPCLALAVVAINTRLGRGTLLLPAILMTSIAALVVWIMLSTYYEITRDLLVAHCGPFSWRIPLQEIIGVCESDSARSGPALSMDRLEIAWRAGVLLISPEDKAGFLTVLQSRAPQLTGRATQR